MCREPRADRTFGSVGARLYPKDTLGLGDRVAEVVERERFEDMPERIGFVSSGIADKSVEALGALKKLKGLQTIASPAFSHNEGRVALGAARILFFDLHWHGWCRADGATCWNFSWIAGLVNAWCGVSRISADEIRVLGRMKSGS